MSDERDELVEHYRGLLEEVYGGKRWIIAMDVLAAMKGLVDRLGDLGAEQVLCVAASRGTGDLPDPELAPDPIVFDVRGEDMMSSIRASVRKLSSLGPDAVARIDAFDPHDEVSVIGPIFDDGAPIAGRPKYGARPPSWQALEDKTVVDALWDEVGIPRSDCEVLGADDVDELIRAAERVDLGAGTVWVADNREGFHGGGSYARWVRSLGDADEAHADLSPHADELRVMPFLEGIPCSIHGIVFPDRTLVLRPCEMLVFRRPGALQFHYGKAASFWDPPDDDRRQMRSIARRVGDHLRETVDYRGAFTVDGIMTVDGFRPTELNPRFGAALGVLTEAVDIPMMLTNLAIVEGEQFDWRSDELEELLVTSADANRGGGTMAVVPVEVEESTHVKLVCEDGAFRRAEDDEDVDATAFVGPHTAGGFVMVNFVADRVPVGPSVAPRALAALQWIDEEYHLEIGRLVAASDVRTPR